MTDAVPPLPFRWDGEAFRPLNEHWARRADAAYAVGEVRNLVPEEQRSRATHNHQFAEIAEAWRNLPEHLSTLFPTADALRKYALIQAGFADVTTFACASMAEARRTAVVVATLDPFAVVKVERDTVLRLTAKSQSLRSMGRDEFQRSKTACLEVVAEMIGVPAHELRQNTARAA